MCSRSSVQWGVSEYMVRFLEKNKNKKTSKVQKPSNEKIASSVTELIDFVAFLIFFFKMGLLRCRWYNCLLHLKNANIQSSCSIITSLISPKALSCTFLRRGSAVFLWPVWMKFIPNIFDRNIDQAMAQQLIR